MVNLTPLVKLLGWTVGAVASLGVWTLVASVIVAVGDFLGGFIPTIVFVFMFALAPILCYVYYKSDPEQENPNFFWKIGRLYGALFFREWSCRRPEQELSLHKKKEAIRQFYVGDEEDGYNKRNFPRGSPFPSDPSYVPFAVYDKRTGSIQKGDIGQAPSFGDEHPQSVPHHAGSEYYPNPMEKRGMGFVGNQRLLSARRPCHDVPDDAWEKQSFDAWGPSCINRTYDLIQNAEIRYGEGEGGKAMYQEG